MKQVATLIKANTEALHNERDVFYVSLGGFDAHSMVESQMETSLASVDEALASFAAEMKAQGLWDQVTIMQTSEFGRTLTSNGEYVLRAARRDDLISSELGSRALSTPQASARTMLGEATIS